MEDSMSPERIIYTDQNLNGAPWKYFWAKICGKESSCMQGKKFQEK